VHGGRGELTFVDLSLTACAAALKSGKLSLVATTIDTVAERMTQRVKDCFRWVARMDRTQAGEVRISAENRFEVTADAASLVAEHDVKIDGSQIRLG
jgi:Protein of unknown function (DUF3540)